MSVSIFFLISIVIVAVIVVHRGLDQSVTRSWRSKWLVVAALVLMGLYTAFTWVMSAAALQSEANPTNGSPSLHISLSSTDPTLDPALVNNKPSRFVTNQLFLGLVRADEETGEPIPELATSWVMSPDALVFTFTLRSGLTWTDGNPLTAYDARYGILRSLDPATHAGEAYSLIWIKNAEEYNSGVITDSNQVGVNVLDYTHLRFTLREAAAYFPSTLTSPAARPMPVWAITAHPNNWTEPAYIVTNGAYKLVSWTHGVSLTLQKNPGYFDAANVQIGKVLFSLVDDATAWEMYQDGELDSAIVPHEEWNSAISDPMVASQLHIASNLGTFYYGFNTSKPPFDSLLVRKAFVAAVNRQGILDTITRYADQPALTFSPPGLWGHVDGSAEGVGIPYNPEMARQWLEAAGYPNGEGLPPIMMMYDTRFYTQNLAIASYIRQNWMDNLSVTVTISETEWNNYLNLLGTDPPQFWQLRWMADHRDSYNFLHDGVDSFGRINYGNWSNPTYESLLALAAHTNNLSTRASLYKQAEEILVETDAVMLPISYYSTGIATKPYLERTYGDGGLDGRIAEWRMNWQLFLPFIIAE